MSDVVKTSYPKRSSSTITREFTNIRGTENKLMYYNKKPVGKWTFKIAIDKVG